MHPARAALAALLSLAALPAAASSTCSAIAEDTARLACFDAAYPARPPSRVIAGAVAPVSGQTEAPADDGGAQRFAGSWWIDTQPSANGGGTDTFLWVDAESEIDCGGQTVRPSVFLRCFEGVPAVLLVTDCKVTSAGVGGLVSYRVDDGATRLRTFVERTDQTALGLWDATAAAPFLRDIRGGTSLSLRFTPMGESRQRDLSFAIDGADQAVAEIEGCGS